MGKGGTVPRIRQQMPSGAITDAGQPLPVRVRYTWTMGPDRVFEDDGWAIAWTRAEVLVVWRKGEMVWALWLPADDVRRR